MRLLVSIGVFVYFAVYFTEAQDLRDRSNKVDSIDDSSKEFHYSKDRPSQQKFTEWDNDNDLEATARGYQSSKKKGSAEEIHEEFQSDLEAIRRFAQNVRPIAKNIRRSMNTRRGMGQEVSVIMKFAKDTIISVIDTAEKYIPHLKPLTKYIRKLIFKSFGH